MKIIPNKTAPLGAEITGVDLSQPLSDEVVGQINSAWQKHLVLVFRRQRINDEQLIAFTRHFGELDPPGPNPYGEPFHQQHPEINVISNIVENGKPKGNLGDGEAVWHQDMTYIDTPPKGAVLYALELPAPEQGGNTYFASLYRAYETLPAELATRLDENLKAIHDASHNSAGMRRKGYAEISDVRQTPGAHHPLVRTTPDGRKALLLGRRPRSYIVGLEVSESEQLLDQLWAHATQPNLAMTHAWQLGDVLMWDNLAVLHKRDAFDPNARRRLHRTQIKG